MNPMLRIFGRTRTAAVIVAAVLCVSCSTDVTAGTTETGEDILFVGNSFTYYNNSLHNHYRRLLRGSENSIEPGTVRAMTISGGRLPEHRDGLRKMLGGSSWDVVVLQGHSRVPIEANTLAGLQSAAKDYAELIRDAGAEPVLFMTWAYSDRPEMTAGLDSAYSNLGRELGAVVAPVGLAFARVTKERPSIRLRTEDRRHPALAGTYLAACVFYAVLRGESPVGNQYAAGLDEEAALYLQRAAWETVQEYSSR